MKPFLMSVSLAVTFTLAASAHAAGIPDRFLWRHGEPIWIAASEAVSNEGRLNAGIMRPGDYEMLRDFRDREMKTPRERRARTDAAEQCDVTFTELLSDGSEVFEARSLVELVQVAATRSVIDGAVTASAVGLHGGVPYTVLQVETNSPEAPAPLVYLLFSKGRMTFDGMTICNDDASFGAVPAIGDAIVFVASEPFDSTGTLFKAAGSWVITEREGAVVAGPALRATLKSVRETVVQLRHERPREASRQ